jgi:hypothetical protein
LFCSRRVVFTLIGVLLLFTALAKLGMLVTDSFADVRVGISKKILWFSLLAELGLAYLNFRQKHPDSLALLNTVVFSSFAIFAAGRLLLGYGGCGCAGNLEIPGWVFLTIDISIVSWFCRNGNARWELIATARELIACGSRCSPERRGRWAGAAVFAGLLLSWVFGWQVPLITPVLERVLGSDTIQTLVRIDDPLILDVQATGQVEIANRSSHPAKIIGISRSCRCFDLSEDPISKIIPANGRLTLPLVIKPNKTGPLHQRVELYVDHPKLFRVNVGVFCSVKGED